MKEEEKAIGVLSRAKNLLEKGLPFACFRYSHAPEIYGNGKMLRQREFWKVFLVLKGSGFMVINGHRYPLVPGTIWLNHPGDMTAFLMEEEVVTCNVCFLPELFEDMLPGLLRENAFFSVFLRDRPLPVEQAKALYSFDSGRKYLPLFNRLEEEYRRLPSNHHAMIKVKLVELLIELSRSSSRQDRRSRSEHLVDRVDEYLRGHYRGEVSFDELAAQLGYSRTRLGTVYRERTGYTLTDALTRRRVEAACRLLETAKDKSVTEIGLLSGFNDLSYFHRQFRKWAGSTPRRYREQKFCGQ